MIITYETGTGLYVNLTNRCSNACDFCVRSHGETVYGNLWLDREPTVEEIKESIFSRDLSAYTEIVFCGYGEPTERLDDLLAVAKHIRSVSDIAIRINTNGLADLICGESTAPKLAGLIDAVSISLNATDREEYLKVVRPRFGIDSYDAMLKFTRDCTRYVPSVVMTVVDVVTSVEEQARCREICESVGATLRIRPYVSN
jgi:radical SAM enzyme (TIGR04100 family)